MRDYPYISAIEVFNDFYYGNGIKHNSIPDTVFCYGDIVTTECGWDLGFHSGESDKVYSRYDSYVYYDDHKPMYGGHNEWYKTGATVTWGEWESLCRKFRTI